MCSDVSKRGKMIRGGELPEDCIADVQDTYKYLGIPQANGNQEEAARSSATAKYLRKVRQVRKSRLNGKNKVQTTMNHHRGTSRTMACTNDRRGSG